MTAAPALRPESWQLTDLLDRAPGLHVLAGTLADLVDEGHPLVVGTADLKYSNGLVRFQERHPGRYVQFGISEQHMVSAAAAWLPPGSSRTSRPSPRSSRCSRASRSAPTPRTRGCRSG